MTAAEKFINDKTEMRNIRINRILEAAFELFAQKGIDTIIMTDIAKKSEIGVASLYRYFDTKDEIAIQTAIWAWNNEKKNFFPVLETPEYENKKGIDQFRTILQLFIKLYESESKFLRFIYFFDSFAVRTGISKERLKTYEENLGSIQNFITAAIHKGLEDGSINSSYKNSEDVLYFTLMHTFFSISQKLTLSGNLLTMDMIVAGKTELEALMEILIKGIKS